ncbi:MAG: metal ABC transporter ATP-binding protein [Armatimonadetes bacterium]|nr:metal ABC transporter ATP-binding protein [Armatimonadota bacterium]
MTREVCPSQGAIITAQHLGYSYPQPPTLALTGVDVQVEAGQFVAVVGPNGSGKTTFVKLLLGLLRPTEGEVSLHGRPAHDTQGGIHHCIGYVPQHRTVNRQVPVRVRDVVAMTAHCRYGGELGGAEVRRRVDRALEMVELSDLAARPFSALSGGQQQRALIARALVVDPLILIADEPFAGVDARSSQTIINLLQWLTDEKSVTVLVVVHDINPLVHFLDRVLLLSTRMVAYGAPSEVLTPAHLNEAYGRAVPILVCDDGFLHPLTEAEHG